jgi:colanic acid biosynthesis glycosyl transferase WcaI
MKVLLLNQCFYPDVVSTAQHLTDFALHLRENGHEVTVVAGSRGYDDPDVRFSRRETWKGIEIRRLPTFGLGKKAKWRRILDFGSFFLSAVMVLLRLKRFDVVVAMTSPPLISLMGSLFVKLKGGRLVFWIMDLNPDEAIAAGWLHEGSLLARALESLLRYSLHTADRIIVLDRFMKDRIVDKGIPEHKLAVIPPWSHDDSVRYDASGRTAFRERHGLAEKYVVMN